jgi:hypothetical protein
MIEDLDRTLEKLLKDSAPPGSELAQADVAFDIPDREWRQQLDTLTLNCYLYSIEENTERRTHEPLLHRTPAGARRVTPPVRVDCAYCITGWSTNETNPVFEEHRLLSQVLRVLLKHKTIPASALVGALVGQIPPYPSVVAAGSKKSDGEFWEALDQQLKPSLNYVVSLAMFLDDEEPTFTSIVEQVDVVARSMSEAARRSE